MIALALPHFPMVNSTVDAVKAKSQISISFVSSARWHRWYRSHPLGDHGPPTTRNAHPHMHDGVAVVHTGIIEKYELRTAFGKGFAFETDTDTETVPVLLSSLMKERGPKMLFVRH